MRPTLVNIMHLVVLSATVVSASPLQSLNERTVPAISGYDYFGCYKEGTPTRALIGFAYFDDLMTVEKCAAKCSSFNIFGVEYGRECYCGDSLYGGSTLAQESDCSMACPGDSEESCGGGNRLNLYTKSGALSTTSLQLSTSTAVGTSTSATAVNTASTSAVVPIVTTSSSMGCYTEATTGRALSGKSWADDMMTIEACQSFCAGFSMFGLEWYRECYCGDVLQGGSVPAPAVQCNHPCSGNNKEICGGDSRLNVYQVGAPTATVVTATASPTASPIATSYASEGCFTEASTGRALSGASYYDDAMTVDMCASVCNGFDTFGVEYGRECYCGNTLNAGSESTALSECNIACQGDGSAMCGGRSRLNLYMYVPLFPSATLCTDTFPTSSSYPTSTSGTSSSDLATSTLSS